MRAKTKPSAERFVEIMDTVKRLREMLAEQERANLDYEHWFRAKQMSEAQDLIADAQTALWRVEEDA